MLRPTRVSVPGSAFRFAYGAFTLFDRLSQHRSATESVCNSPIPLRQVPDKPHNPHCATPAGLARNRFRLHPFRSPLLRASLRFLLLRLLRCFTSPGDRLHRGDWAQHPAGFPHSEICGSKVACTSPQLIAACHVLLRPQAPRHSPCALSTLTPNTSSSCFSFPLGFNCQGPRGVDWHSIFGQKNGGDDRIRTDDILLAKQEV